MPDIMRESAYPLLWNADGDPFPAPPEAIALKVRRYSGGPGRPPVVYSREGVLHVALDTTMEQFRKSVQGEVGSYRLYPIDADDNELEPVAVVEVLPDQGNDLVPLSQTPDDDDDDDDESRPISMSYAEIPYRFFDLYDRMLASRDAHDQLLSKLLSTLVSTTATIQQSTAGLLQAANTTVKVANGVEALERSEPAQQDIQAITEQLATLGKLKDTIAALADGNTATPPWFVQLLNGPVGIGLMSFANNFAQAAAKAQAQAATEDDE